MSDMQETFEQIEQIVVAGASALREALGVPVTARDVEEVSDAGADASAHGVVARVATPAGAVVVTGAADELEAAGDPAAITGGLAAQIAVAAGFDGGEPETLDSFAESGLDAPAAVQFTVTVDGASARMLVAVENALFGGGDGAPGEAADAPTVARAPLPDLGNGNGIGNGGRDLNVLSDVSMKVTVQLGHTQLLVRDLLALSEGSVVELDQAPGTPVDILVNGTAVARGDVVVVHDDLGVRITEVLGHTE